MNYNGDMLKMQQDAIRRVREMQARAKSSIEGTSHLKNQNNDSNTNSSDNDNDNNGDCKESSTDNKLPIQNNINSLSKSNNLKQCNHKPNNHLGILDFFIKDEERSLILILLILLMNEKDNINIVLTLIYLLI